MRFRVQTVDEARAKIRIWGGREELGEIATAIVRALADGPDERETRYVSPLGLDVTVLIDRPGQPAPEDGG